MNASLNEKLRAVKWGEFKYKEVFNRIEQGRRLKKDDQIDGTIPFVMSGTTNAGVVNYISNPVASFPKNAITIDIFGNTFYRNYAFGAGDDTGVYWTILNKQKPILLSVLVPSVEETFKNTSIKLPETADGKIDFDFMESFIAELEAERVAELSAYLTVSGLDNYELSSDEENALKNYQSLKWDTYNLEKLFGKSTRGKRLKGDDRIAGTLPFVTAGEASEGISAYISNEVEVFEKNTTTIDMFGSAKYRNYKYGADDHVAVVHTEAVPMKAAIFVTSACHKAAHTGKFDYGHNFYAKDADALYISLPVNEAGNPDYGKMAIIISAIHKLVIKDVVSFTDRKIAGTKEVIAK